MKMMSARVSPRFQKIKKGLTGTTLGALPNTVCHSNSNHQPKQISNRIPIKHKLLLPHHSQPSTTPIHFHLHQIMISTQTTNAHHFHDPIWMHSPNHCFHNCMDCLQAGSSLRQRQRQRQCKKTKIKTRRSHGKIKQTSFRDPMTIKNCNPHPQFKPHEVEQEQVEARWSKLLVLLIIS